MGLTVVASAMASAARAATAVISDPIVDSMVVTSILSTGMVMKRSLCDAKSDGAISFLVVLGPAFSRLVDDESVHAILEIDVESGVSPKVAVEVVLDDLSNNAVPMLAVSHVKLVSNKTGHGIHLIIAELSHGLRGHLDGILFKLSGSFGLNDLDATVSLLLSIVDDFTGVLSHISVLSFHLPLEYSNAIESSLGYAASWVNLTTLHLLIAGTVAGILLDLLLPRNNPFYLWWCLIDNSLNLWWFILKLNSSSDNWLGFYLWHDHFCDDLFRNILLFSLHHLWLFNLVSLALHLFLFNVSLNHNFILYDYFFSLTRKLRRLDWNSHMFPINWNLDFSNNLFDDFNRNVTFSNNFLDNLNFLNDFDFFDYLHFFDDFSDFNSNFWFGNNNFFYHLRYNNRNWDDDFFLYLNNWLGHMHHNRFWNRHMDFHFFNFRFHHWYLNLYGLDDGNWYFYRDLMVVVNFFLFMVVMMMNFLHDFNDLNFWLLVIMLMSNMLMSAFVVMMSNRRFLNNWGGMMMMNNLLSWFVVNLLDDFDLSWLLNNNWEWCFENWSCNDWLWNKNWLWFWDHLLSDMHAGAYKSSFWNRCGNHFFDNLNLLNFNFFDLYNFNWYFYSLDLNLFNNLDDGLGLFIVDEASGHVCFPFYWCGYLVAGGDVSFCGDWCRGLVVKLYSNFGGLENALFRYYIHNGVVEFTTGSS